MKAAKHVLSVVLIILPVLYLVFLIPDRFGVWDRLSGLSFVEDVAARFQLSYAPDASKPVRVGEKEWLPLLRLVEHYTLVKLPKDRQPRVIARFQAIASARLPGQGPVEAEWTAPGTPIVIFYRDWPTNSGVGIPPEDYRIVGTIGDLQDWITRAKDYRRFLVQDIFLGLFTTLLGLTIFLIDLKAENPSLR